MGAILAYPQFLLSESNALSTGKNTGTYLRTQLTKLK